MTVKIAITGFGRIGRLILRAIYELNHQDIKVVAINASRGDTASNAHLLKYDSAHGKFNADIKTNDHESARSNSFSNSHCLLLIIPYICGCSRLQTMCFDFPQAFTKYRHTTDQFHCQMSIKTKQQ